MAHFAPDVTKRLKELEAEGGVDVEKLDWTPIYQTWPELQRILDECKREIKSQKIVKLGEAQRPKLREYILIKLGKLKKGAPILLSQEVVKVVDQFLANL